MYMYIDIDISNMHMCTCLFVCLVSILGIFITCS